jgi:hypothetical protein
LVDGFEEVGPLLTKPFDELLAAVQASEVSQKVFELGSIK